MSPLSPDRESKVRQIKAALGQSDRAVHDLFFSLDTFERSAKKSTTGNVSVAWLEALDKLRAELLRARDRLDDLHTGLRAQAVLRKSLIQFAAGVAAWRFALEESDPKEIAAARLRMVRHFNLAAIDARDGASYLKAGR